MPARHAICIVVDGLRASALGCYGNTWSPTPALDRLASESLTADWLICDSPYTEDFYRSLWQGRPVWSQAENSTSLLGALSRAGVTSSCVTDEPNLASWAPELAKIHTVRVSPPEQQAHSAADCEISRLFEAAVSHLADVFGDGAEESSSKLVWIHARGLVGGWDAPLPLRGELLDEEDPPPLQFTSPPDRIESTDPDEALGYRAAYAAQVGVLDAAVGGLLDVVQQWQIAQETLILLAGCRGFALGEHGVIGTACDSLYSEVLHVPLLLSIGDLATPERLSRLIQPFDLGRLLALWFAGGGEGAPAVAGDFDQCVAAALAGRDLALARNRRGKISVRTPAWLMIDGGNDAASDDPELIRRADQPQLFVKPDDRWEANEVSALREEVVRGLSSVASVAVRWPASEGDSAVEIDPLLLAPEC